MGNWNIKYPFVAGEDLHTEGHEGVAIALDDGKVANDGQEATGILASKPKSGEHGSMIIVGVGDGRAGVALTKNQRVRVTESGYFVAGNSGYYDTGRAMDAITSGSIGPIFKWPSAQYRVSSL